MQKMATLVDKRAKMYFYLYNDTKTSLLLICYTGYFCTGETGKERHLLVWKINIPAVTNINKSTQKWQISSEERDERKSLKQFLKGLRLLQ